MQLMYSNCVPKLTYGAAVKDLNASEKHQYNVAVNNATHLVSVYGGGLLVRTSDSDSGSE